MSWLVVVEQRNGRPASGALGVLSWAAAQESVDADAFVGGEGAASAAAGLGTFGATGVHVVEDARLATDPEPYTDTLADLLDSEAYEIVLFDTTILTSAVAAALAVRLDCGLNWDVAEITRGDRGFEGRRLALGDSVVVRVGWKDAQTRLALMRPNTHVPAPLPRDGSIENRPASIRNTSLRVTVLERAPYHEASGKPIEDEDVLVAAGCGIRASEDLSMLVELAEALGGGLAATLPLADRRWVPYATQVGQTGKTVTPRLYLACGISGAVQHRVGMQGAETVIAINTDATAPIFDHCDLGVVGDLYEIVPELLSRLRGT